MIWNNDEIYGVIYVITHIASGKQYVGQTTNWTRRRRDYHSLRCKSQPKLYAALNVHGPGAFTFERVANALSPAELNRLECDYIRRYNTVIDGYNCSTGGVSGKRGPETRAKVSAALRGRKLSPETRAKISAAHKGKKVSQETCAKLSEAHKGKKLSPEARAKIGAANKGRKASPEARAKMSAAHKGRKHSPEHRARIGAARRAHFATLKLTANQFQQGDNHDQGIREAV